MVENFKLILHRFRPFFKNELDQTVLLERRDLSITAFLRAINLLQELADDLFAAFRHSTIRDHKSVLLLFVQISAKDARYLRFILVLMA